MDIGFEMVVSVGSFAASVVNAAEFGLVSEEGCGRRIGAGN